MTIERARYNPAGLNADLQYLGQAYQEEGFLEAKIGPPDVQIKKLDKGEGAFIRIPIMEGPRYTLGKLTIKNVQVFETQTLAQMSPLQKGKPYRRSEVAQWQEKIAEAYNSLGYLRAVCKAQESVNDKDKTVECILDCVEGRTYTVGKITLIADDSIDRRQFRRHLLLNEGGIYNFENLALSVQFLNQMGIYKRFSYSDVQISLDDAKGTVDVTFRLSPRAQN